MHGFRGEIRPKRPDGGPSQVWLGKGSPVKLWLGNAGIEESAKKQLQLLAQMPFLYKHLAVMPDVHAGIGSTVGTVMATKGAVIPAAVGVDIGCGMMAQSLGLTIGDLPDDLSGIRHAIEAAVPHGVGKGGSFPTLGIHQQDALELLHAEFKEKVAEVAPELAEHPWANQVGTLGGGNHFVELSGDNEGGIWVVLHSGSRGIGNRIGERFISLAKEDMRTHFINLPDENLAYLPEGTEHFEEYIDAVGWAQEYALINRTVMMMNILEALQPFFGTKKIEGVPRGMAIQCHHNYVKKEKHFGEEIWITRKGAIEANLGSFGIIPGAMGRSTFIVSGKGNPESFNSASHGAGRVMSRGDARRKFTLEDHRAATVGLEHDVRESILDETPDAYKNIKDVMAAQTGLVTILWTLEALVCVKG